MATIKSYTDLSQSKTLSKILPLESADMSWVSCDDGKQKYYQAENRKIILNYEKNHWLPCWGLAALLDFISLHSLYNLDYDGIAFVLTVKDFEVIGDNPIDACYEMILKLHEQKLL